MCHACIKVFFGKVIPGIVLVVLSSAQAEIPDGVIGWWKFDEPAGTTVFTNLANPEWNAVATDSAKMYSGGRSVYTHMYDTAGGSSVRDNFYSVAGTGGEGTGLRLDGSAASAKPASFTFECFFKLDASYSGTVWQRIANRRLKTASATWNVWGLWVEKRADGLSYGIRARFDDGSYGKWFNQLVPVSVGAWHHVALSYDAGSNSAALYLDYSLVVRETLNFDKNKNVTLNFPGLCYSGDAAGPYGIGGCEEYPQQGLCGWIDEARLFDRAIDPDKFLRPAPPVGIRSDTLVWFRMDPTVSEGKQQIIPNAVPFSSASDGYFLPNETYSNCSDSVYFYSSDAPDLLYGTAAPSTRLENVHSLVFPALIFTNGVTNTSVRFDTPNLGVSYTCYTNSFTFETVFKANKTSGGAQRLLMSRAQQGNPSSYDFKFYLDVGNNLSFALYTNNTASTAFLQYKQQSEYLDGNWHAAAAVYDHTLHQMRLYLDARPVGSRDLVPETALYCRNSARSFYLGAWEYEGEAGSAFNGLIDEARVTLAALPPEELLCVRPSRLRLTSPRTVHLPFDGDATVVSNEVSGSGFTIGHGCALVFTNDFAVASRNRNRVSDGTDERFIHENTGSLALGVGGASLSDSSGLFDGFTNFTVEAFLRYRTEDVTFASVIMRKFGGLHDVDSVSSPVSYAAWTLRDLDGNLTVRTDTVSVNGSDSVSDGQLNVKSPYGDGKWHHVALSYQWNEAETNTTLRFYVDYTLLAETNYPGCLKDKDNPGAFLISAGGTFKGCLDELRLTEGILSAEEFLRAMGVPGNVIMLR